MANKNTDSQAVAYENTYAQTANGDTHSNADSNAHTYGPHANTNADAYLNANTDARTANQHTNTSATHRNPNTR